MTGSLLPILGLASAGLVLALGAAGIAARLGRSERGARIAPFVAAAGIVLAAALPYGWIWLFGRPA